jgi:hypothetical protein
MFLVVVIKFINLPCFIFSITGNGFQTTAVDVPCHDAFVT